MAVILGLIVCLIDTTAVLLSVSGTKINSKYVCSGDSVQAFQDIIFEPCDGFVSLTANGRRNKQIAMWSFQNCITKSTVLNEYKDRVFLYKNGTITIYNITNFDHGNYIVHSKKDHLSHIQEVNIYIPDAPSKSCKPIIEQWGNKLLASLTSEECGRPAVTTYWKGDDGVSDTVIYAAEITKCLIRLNRDQLLKIAEGNTAPIYTACIEGPALQCAKNLTSIETCSSYVILLNKTIPVSTSHEGLDGITLQTSYFIFALVILMALISLAVIQIICFSRLKKILETFSTNFWESAAFGEEYKSLKKCKEEERGACRTREIRRIGLEPMSEEGSGRGACRTREIKTISLEPMYEEGNVVLL